MKDTITCDFVETPFGHYTVINDRVNRVTRDENEPDYTEQIGTLAQLVEDTDIPGAKIRWIYSYTGQDYEVGSFRLSDYQSTVDAAVEGIRKSFEEKASHEAQDIRPDSLIEILDRVSPDNSREENEEILDEFGFRFQRYANRVRRYERPEFEEQAVRRYVEKQLSRHVWDHFIRRQVEMPFDDYDGSYIGDGFCNVDEDEIRFFHVSRQTATYDITQKETLPQMYDNMERQRITFERKEGTVSQMR